MTEYWLRYGKTEVSFELPDDSNAVVFQPSIGFDEPFDATTIVDSLLNDQGTRENLRGTKRPVIVVDSIDPTVEDAMSQILKGLINEILKLTEELARPLVIAPFTPGYSPRRKKIQELLDAEQRAKTEILFHDPYSSSTTKLAPNDGAVLTELSSAYCESSLRVLITVPRPSPFFRSLGTYSNMLIGLSSKKTFDGLYKLAFEHERAGTEEVAEEAIGEIGQMIKPEIEICIFPGKSERQPVVMYGESGEVDRRAKQLIEDLLMPRIHSRFPLVVLGCGGSPYDDSLISTTNTVDNARGVLSEGGVIIVAAECSEGVGSEALEHYLFLGNSVEELEDELQKNFSFEAFTAYRIRNLSRHSKVGLVSIIPRTFVSEFLDFRPFDTVSEAVHYGTRVKGKESPVAILPSGQFVRPEPVST